MGFARPRTLAILALVFCINSTPRADAQKPAQSPSESLQHFERSVRPVLAEHCISCHGPAKQKGGLRLDTRAGLIAGGDTGPAITPGKPTESLLVEAVHQSGDLKMPPKKKLGANEVAAIEKWIQLGAPWPDSVGSGASKSVARSGEITDEDRKWWAFQPVSHPSPPHIADKSWPRNPVDQFVLAKLDREKLTPAPEADKLALIRRATFDVTGLPPTPPEIDAFLADRSSDAYEKLVDRLLASSQYGERWARHWLDLVRYAESDGYRIDQYRPNAWLYRDYVIRSLNQDKPYSRFVQEQIAGDELFPGDPDALTATGYLRHGIYEYNNRDARGQWSVMLNDITDTTADVFLGLGLQCARCHNHKFDPLLQADYYRLQAFFAPLLLRDDLTAAPPAEVANYQKSLAEWESKTFELRSQLAKLEAKYRTIAATGAINKFPDDIQEMIRRPVDKRSPLEHQLAELAYRQVDYEYDKIDTYLKGDDKEKVLALRKQLAAFEKLKPAPLSRPLAVTDVGPNAPGVTIPKKGDTTIAPGFPTILDSRPAEIHPIPGVPNSTGRRATLANWLTRDDNPLTSRVIVNRIWQHHFGRGLAENPSDFGRLGSPPTHPELLDWLTSEFIKNGWKFKHLHRLILTSATYRQSTVHPQIAQHQLKDPDNRFYWRGSTRRLSAEQIRDSVLAVTGELDRKPGGAGVLATEPRRTIYTRALRNTRDPLLDVFDLPLFFSSEASRDTTTSPLQSLLLINSQTMLLRAEALAKRLERELGPSASADDQIRAAYLLAFGRQPTEEERANSREFLKKQMTRIDPGEASVADASFLREKIPYRDGYSAVLVPGTSQQRLEVPHNRALDTGNFTVEGFFVIHSVYDTASVRTIASKWNGDMKRSGWAFGVTGKGSRRKPQTLVLQMIGQQADNSFGEAAIFSDQTIQLNRPYFAAASVTLADPKKGKGSGTVTFYLKDISNDDEPLLIAKVPHSITGDIGNDLSLTIGGLGGKASSFFDGLIDDVRISDAALDTAQLLYTAEGAGKSSIGYWRFETDPGVFRDGTGHGLDLRPVAKNRGKVDLKHAALTDFCHVLLNASEFLYVN